MRKQYSTDETVAKTEAAMRGKIDLIYRKSFINWKGVTNDSDKPYTEVIAKELIKPQYTVDLGSIPPIHRKSYLTSHVGAISGQSNRREENLAKALYVLHNEKSKHRLGSLGIVFDYQIPLKSSNKDKAGKIDLVTFDDTNNTVWLLELKQSDSKETLLRCVLEIATYYQLLDRDIFIKTHAFLKKHNDPSICKAVLILENSYQHKELIQMRQGDRDQLKKLADCLDVSFFILRIDARKA